MNNVNNNSYAICNKRRPLNTRFNICGASEEYFNKCGYNGKLVNKRMFDGVVTRLCAKYNR